MSPCLILSATFLGRNNPFQLTEQETEALRDEVDRSELEFMSRSVHVSSGGYHPHLKVALMDHLYHQVRRVRSLNQESGVHPEMPGTQPVCHLLAQ